MQATVLCDRLGIFVDGQLVCIGNPKELTARYGGYYVSCLLTVFFLRFDMHGLKVCVPHAIRRATPQTARISMSCRYVIAVNGKT